MKRVPSSFFDGQRQLYIRFKRNQRFSGDVKLQVCGRIVRLFLGNLMRAISDQNALAVPKSLKRYRRAVYELSKEVAWYPVK